MPSIAYLDLKYDKSYFTNKIYNNAITLTALVNDCQIGFYCPTSGTYYIDLSISYDNGMTWTDIHLSSGSGFYYPDPIDAGNTIMVVGRENHHNYGCNGLHIFSEEDNYFNVSGNLTSLLDTDFALVEREWPIVKGMMSNCFQNLFASFNVSNTTYKSYVKDASDLVFTNLDPTSYFYAGMFSGCTSLEKAPKTLSTKINSTSCCNGMFNGCTSLTTAPELPATTLALACYGQMFSGCTSLTTAPELPATTLALACYEYMFNGCTSLSVIPRLPATTLAQNCYTGMFQDCTSLTTAPELPAITLQPNCYREMFKGCTSLTTAPQLPATELRSGCYIEMFNGCTSLNYIKILATSWPSSSYLEDHITDWVADVAPTGIFVKDTNTTYEIDSDSGVPTGWTVYDIGEYIPQSYTVTITVDPNGSGTVSGAGTYQEGSSVALIATPETGYRFVGWYDHYGTVSTNTMYIFTINRHEEFLAQFAEIDYYTVILSQDPSIGATLTGAGTYADGSTVTITASNVEEYNFIGWYNNGNLISSNSTYTFTIDDDISLVAVYGESIGYNHTYFTIETLEDGGKFRLDFSNLKAGSSIQVKYNNSQWYTITTSTDDSSYSQSFKDLMVQLTGNNDGIVNTGDRLSLRRFNRTGYTTTSVIPCIKVHANVRYIAYGNIASIYQSHDDISKMTDEYYAGINLTTMNTDETYHGMFASGDVEEQKLVDASNLVLPFTTLADYAYESMFALCTSLTSAPELPATTLAFECYLNMFEYCFSLTTAPALPATTLAEGCYSGMFRYCHSLVNAPALPATTLAEGCYASMFFQCQSLVNAPALPATTLAIACYESMFHECTSLVNAPALPATTLTDWCYSQMFDSCYRLVNAPDLPATTLVRLCYQSMFSNCNLLNNIKCLATNIDAYGATRGWMYGVSETGTFIKDSNATWSSSGDGIPTGWTVVDI